MKKFQLKTKSDEKNEDGCTVHKYGSHIFHTNDEKVWKFLNKYTKFNSYEHRVRANTSEGQGYWPRACQPTHFGKA